MCACAQRWLIDFKRLQSNPLNWYKAKNSFYFITSNTNRNTLDACHANAFLTVSLSTLQKQFKLVFAFSNLSLIGFFIPVHFCAHHFSDSTLAVIKNLSRWEWKRVSSSSLQSTFQGNFKTAIHTWAQHSFHIQCSIGFLTETSNIYSTMNCWVRRIIIFIRISIFSYIFFRYFWYFPLFTS